MRRPRPVPVSWLVGLITVVLLAGCADTSPAPDVDDARLIAADSDDENWLTYGRTYKEQRHSPLTEVSEETVGQRRSLHQHGALTSVLLEVPG